MAPVTATRVVHASDPDDEVRCVVRLLAGKLEEVPAHRVAVLYGAAEPYARLLAEHLGAAGITANGAAARPVIERAFPRTLLGLLALPDHGWRRDEVLALLAEAPVRGHDGQRVPASRWERISRAAGVAAGGDWEPRLAGYAAAQRSAAARERVSDAPREGLIARRERDAQAADALRGIRRRAEGPCRGRRRAEARGRSWLSGPPPRSVPCSVTSATSRGCLRGRPGPRRRWRGSCPGWRASAWSSRWLIWPRCGSRSAWNWPMTCRVRDGSARACWWLRWARLSGWTPTLSSWPGWPRSWCRAGCVRMRCCPSGSGRWPRGSWPRCGSGPDRQHRHLLAALAAAPERIVSFPRGDLRRSAARLPSRWLLPSLRVLSGEPGLQATRWESVSGPWLTGSPSYAASLAQRQGAAE